MSAPHLRSADHRRTTCTAAAAGAHPRPERGRAHACVSPSACTPGRKAYVAAARLAPPTSDSYRTFLFGRAIGGLEGTDVDTELLFAGALLHDTGLTNPTGAADFTLTSARLAREVAARVGLSTAATETMLSAITQHYTPGVTIDAGPVAYLLAAGAAVDVVGLRSWDLPPATI